MKSLPLFPNRYKKIGWFIFIPSIVAGILLLLFDSPFREVNIFVFYNSGFLFSNEVGFFKTANLDILTNVVGLLIVIGGLMVGFSKEKNEDEYIASLRLNAMFWSIIFSYLIVFFLILMVFGTVFFSVLLVVMFLPLILYIIRFNYLMMRDEK